ncbi:hypothetical protein AX16_004575 [Volvariella volvacea WC 439]|nr:hypothetical protein AX16_004575 [Volvariella volvacea WC 439]
MVHFQFLESIKKSRTVATLFLGHRNKSRKTGSERDARKMPSPGVAKRSHDVDRLVVRHQQPVPVEFTTIEDYERFFEDCYDTLKGDSASFVLQVDDVLFKVPGSVLCQTDCMFNDLLDLPTPSDSDQGKGGTQDDSIQLDDTAAQFRDLLWALYAYQLSEYVLFSSSQCQ